VEYAALVTSQELPRSLFMSILLLLGWVWRNRNTWRNHIAHHLRSEVR